MRPPSASCTHRARANPYIIIYASSCRIVVCTAPGWHARANLPITPHTSCPPLLPHACGKGRHLIRKVAVANAHTSTLATAAFSFLCCHLLCYHGRIIFTFCAYGRKTGLFCWGFCSFWGYPLLFLFFAPDNSHTDNYNTVDRKRPPRRPKTAPGRQMLFCICSCRVLFCPARQRMKERMCIYTQRGCCIKNPYISLLSLRLSSFFLCPCDRQ